MTSSILVHDRNYYYKGIKYDSSELNILLNKIGKKRRIILCSENIFIKKYNYHGNNIEKFIDNKISEDFNNKENLLFHYEIDKENKVVYLYSIRNNIKSLYENVKILSIDLIQFKLKNTVVKKIKGINNIIILYSMKNIIHLIKICNNIIIDTMLSKDIKDIEEYLNLKQEKKYILVKDIKYKGINNIDFDYSIDLGADVYEKTCEES